MAVKTKTQLKQQSNVTYPTNGNGAISAQNVRAFNEDLIDSIPEPSSLFNGLPVVAAGRVDWNGNVYASNGSIQCSVSRISSGHYRISHPFIEEVVFLPMVSIIGGLGMINIYEIGSTYFDVKTNIYDSPTTFAQDDCGFIFYVIRLDI